MQYKHAGKLNALSKLLYSGLACFTSLVLITLGYSFAQSMQERNERAALYAHMVESTLSRTFEALEVSLASFSNDLAHSQLSATEREAIRIQLLETLQFAPHLRQIVLVKGQETLIDTRNTDPQPLNLPVLGLNPANASQFSLGLLFGNVIKGRFLPFKGTIASEAEHREILPIGLEITTQSNEKLLLIAAFNPGYIKRYLQDLPLQPRDRLYVVNFDGNSLIQYGLYGPYKQEVMQGLQRTLHDDFEVTQYQDDHPFIPSHSTTIRLVAKYPLAVTLITDHLGSFAKWAYEMKTLFFILWIVLLVLLTGGYLVLRSNRKALEMKEEVHLLSEVVEHTPTVIVITDAEGHIEYVNQSFEKETGYQKAEVIGKNPRLLQSGETSNEQYAHMWQMLTRGQTWTGEFHNKRKDGSLYWERASIGPLKDLDGEITHFIALKQPIDDEKAAQEQIRLASTVFDSATEAIMVTTLDNRIQMVNPAFKTITGYSAQEVIGKTPSLLRSGRHNADFYSNLYASLKAQGSWEGEIWNRRKNGEVYPQWLMISSRYDQHGSLEGYIAIFSDITQRKHDEALIRKQANYDPVTALPNRNLFADRLKQALLQAERNNAQSALLFIDLDRFKSVNDNFGHPIGDLLLRHVAERLTAQVRKSDTVARLGGDEFAVILTNLNDLGIVEQIAHKILESLARPYQLQEHEVFISCSIGIAFYPDHASESDTLIIHADSAMYKAKQKGRNTFEYFEAMPDTDFSRRRDIETGLFKALELQQFYLVYQPIWSTDQRRIESIEALIRWQHPTLGLVPPAEFIPLAEASGLIHSIGQWVIESCCAFARQLHDTYSHPPIVSLNTSSTQFMRDHLDEIIANALKHHQLPGTALIVEITESVLMLDQQEIQHQLTHLVQLGVAISIDDFGTGFSSLSYLKKYPIQRIKIDRSFIQEIATNPEDRALVSGILSLADSLGLKTTVEGVETQAQLDVIQSYGSPMIQGYLYSPPLSAEQLTLLLSQRDLTEH